MSRTKKVDTTIGDANYNKRQFWPYQRLKGKGSRSSRSSKNNKLLDKKQSSSQSKKKIFHLVNNHIATDKELVKRLDSIYIPPAYKDIIVAKSANNKIQAIGTDTRGRRQYVYNPKYTQKRNDRKYDFILDLGKKIIQIEKDNDTMLNTLSSKSIESWTLPDDYIPIIIYMLRTYHFRIGNEKYANDNNSYGITTLKKEHIHFFSDGKENHMGKNYNNHNNHITKITIEFIGKKGILNTFTDKNPSSKIIKIFKTLIKNGSSDGYLFKYNHNGVKQFITTEHINSFFKTKYDAEITPKMFRTWYGNFHMLSHLRKLFNQDKLKPKMTKAEKNLIIKECSEHVSSKLNNTPTVSKQSYIDNKILNLVVRNPYRLARKIPDTVDGQHKFLYQIIQKLRE